MTTRVRVSVCLSLCLCFILAGRNTAAGEEIVCSISFPDQTASPPRGTSFALKAWRRVAPDQIRQVAQQTITLPATGSQTSLRLPPGEYLLAVTTPWDAVLPVSWWSPNGSTALQSDAAAIRLEAGQSRRIEIRLVRGIELSGVLELPEGVRLATPTSLKLHLRQGDDFFPVDQTLRLEPGRTRFPWKMRIPASPATVNHGLYYSGLDLPGCLSEISDNYAFDMYKTVFPTQTVDRKSLTLRVVPLATITGTIRLPEGRRAPAGGLALQAVVVPDQFFSRTHTRQDLRIPEGANSIPFAVTFPVPRRSGRKLYLRYYGDIPGYQRSGYWSPAGTLRHGPLPEASVLPLTSLQGRQFELTLIPDEKALTIAQEEARARDIRDALQRSLLRPHWTPFEKALVAFEWTGTNLGYWGPLIARNRGVPASDAVFGWASSYVYKVTQCGGFTGVMNDLLRHAGLSLRTGVNAFHAWNRIQIGGRWYNADATAGKGRYFSFLLSNPQYGKLCYHPGKPDSLAACTDLFRFDPKVHVPNINEIRSAERVRVMGMVSMARGQRAPQGGLEAWVGNTKLHIPEGESKVFFVCSFNRGQQQERYLDVAIRSDRFSWDGYLGTGNRLVTQARDALVIPTGATGRDLVDVDITLPEIPVVRYEVSLPGEDVLKLDFLQVEISVLNAATRHGFTRRVMLTGGANRGVLTDILPDNSASYIIQYRIPEGLTPYLTRGWPGKTGMTGKQSESLPFRRQAGKDNTIRLELIPARTARLTLSVDPKVLDPTIGTRVHYMLRNAKGDLLVNSSTDLPPRVSKTNVLLTLQDAQEELFLMAYAAQEPRGATRYTPVTPRWWLTKEGLQGEFAGRKGLRPKDLQSGVSIELTGGKRFQGMVIGPGIVTAQEGFSYELCVREYREGRWTDWRVAATYRIARGGSRLAFDFIIAAQPGTTAWQLSYRTRDSFTTLKTGYWTSRGPVADQARAENLPTDGRAIRIEMPAF